ncbi:NACHT domain-containing protein [Sphingomonas sp. R86521]|uniref:NACHT domain-containing protein n=1 Tax=Sphingomonas sp. R86521 TaxID=3093860 RepID=UPI0036D3ACF0
MPDISFVDFSSRSFEQFTQALAAAVLGSGLLIFGDGADGGREAEFVGAVPYPNPLSPWQRRTVLQTKFRHRAQGAEDDASWLVRQLRTEAKRYELGGRDIPDHYLLATNVRLSGVKGLGRKGGQEKLQDAFDEYLRPLGVTDFDVWHEEKIATLLDLHPDLFRSYGAWLGGREALAAVYRSFDAKIPKFGATMLLYLQRELRSQRTTRLQQAGHVGDAPTFLEDLFIDLPFLVDKDRARGLSGLRTQPDQTTDGSGILHSLLDAVALKLDPRTIETGRPDSHLALTNRFLILGGPGQGKTTITQFLGQVMRFRLLREEKPASLAPDTVRAVAAIATRLSELEVPLEGVRRYPLRIDLPLFADALTKAEQEGGRLSLLEFVGRSMAAVTSSPSLDVAILRDWLEAYPFLIMLDGLDEVPPSGARREVIAAILDFWDEAGARNADIAMTITTRPQGYNDDLDPSLWLRLEMSRLTPRQALAYAERVALAKLPDQERRETVLLRLAAAAENDATARLMVSPLQVAILFQLVDQRGTAPTDRWTLFAEYLSVVMKREQEKTGPGGDIVRAQEPLIVRLLGRVGLLLHVEAELGGKAHAFIGRDRLELVTTDLLEEEGYDGSALRDLASAIILAATDRLVFLEQRIEGQIEFDVRSLQEFMAAAELMSGSDEQVRCRLQEIAGRTHWQHVYRIAASKAFSATDAVRFRDAVLAINRELDEESSGTRAVRQGALTSLDLLADGLGTNQPLYRKLLSRHALELLAVCTKTDGRLSGIIASLGEEDARKMLSPHLTTERSSERRAAWAVLLPCIEERDDWADRLSQEHWPTCGEARLDVMMCGEMPPVPSRTAELISAYLDEASPAEIRSWRHGFDASQREFVEQLAGRYPFLRPLLGRTKSESISVDVLPTFDANLSVSLTPMADEKLLPEFHAPATRPWALFHGVANYLTSPSVKTTAAFVSMLEDPMELQLAKLVNLPWPLESLARIVANGRPSLEVVAALHDGDFGDEEEWIDGQERLAEKGMNEADLAFWSSGILFDAWIADCGMPYVGSISLSHRPAAKPGWLEMLLNAAFEAPEGASLELLRWMLGFILPRIATEQPLTPRQWMHLFGPATKLSRPLDADLLSILDEAALGDPTLLDYVAAQGEDADLSLGQRGSHLGVAAESLLAASNRDGIMVAALAMVAQDGSLLPEFAKRLEPRLESASTSPAVRDTIAAARIINGKGPVDYCALTGAPGDSVGQHAIIVFSQTASTSTPMVEDALAHIATMAIEAERVQSRAIAALTRMLDRRHSDLAQPEVWKRLGLPANLMSRLDLQ